MSVLVDSYAWIEYFSGTTLGEKARDLIEGTEHLVVSSLNVAEVYLKEFREKGESIAEARRAFIRRRCEVVDVSEEIAVEAAKVRFSSGFGIVDAVILATARRKNAKILTGDKHFRNLENVIFLG